MTHLTTGCFFFRSKAYVWSRRHSDPWRECNVVVRHDISSDHWGCRSAPRSWILSITQLGFSSWDASSHIFNETDKHHWKYWCWRNVGGWRVDVRRWNRDPIIQLYHAVRLHREGSLTFLIRAQRCLMDVCQLTCSHMVYVVPLWLVVWLVYGLVGWSVMIGCLVGWLAGWMADWLVEITEFVNFYNVF